MLADLMVYETQNGVESCGLSHAVERNRGTLVGTVLDTIPGTLFDAARKNVGRMLDCMRAHDKKKR
jgi:hypothetical protein